MKKGFLGLLVLSLFAAAALISCEKKAANPGDSANAGKPRVGVIDLFSSDNASARANRLAQDTVAEAAGIELVRVQLGGYDDESFMTAYESMVSQKVDAVVCYTLSETVLPLLKDLFEKNKVKFFLANRMVSTPQMKEMLFGSPMCIGNDYCDETQNAYNMIKYMHETYGVKNLAVIGLTKGDINGDYRDAGITAACKDIGINLLAETRGIGTTEDVTKAVEGFIASYREMDGIFIVGGVVTPGALAGANQALVNHNLADKVVIGMVDIATGMLEYMDDGPLKVVAGGNLICDNIFSLVVLANNLRGTPLSGDDISIILVNMFWITNSEDAGNYDKYIEGTISPFTVEEYKKLMFKFENPGVTLDSIQKIASEFSIASVRERHADMF
jgi:ABC-type sugar transport system substrate-binding protein